MGVKLAGERERGERRTGLLSGEQKGRADASGGGGEGPEKEKGKGGKHKARCRHQTREKERTTDGRDGSAESTNCSNVRE